ncbi:MAG: aminoacyl-histidine dipeptidase [Chitinophagaceae bacterium]
MNEAVRELQPITLWNYFADLNAVPRPSKKEERAIQFIQTFGEGLGLPTEVDKVGNVVIRKPATKGYENKATVVLQSHLDMVHQKNADVDFDFATQGIQMQVDGDWVKAKGTTLGADNGIGVATIMAILVSTDIEHPPLEALFTIDEETGMTGAKGLSADLLKGKYLLNLDTEDDYELTIGCAGGIDVTCSGQYETKKANDVQFYQLMIKGLTGGHSGMEIQKGLANVNKLMNRLLVELSREIKIDISCINGGGLRNAIPRESVAIIAIASTMVDSLKNAVKKWEDIFKKEYAFTDKNLQVALVPHTKQESLLEDQFRENLLQALYACPNGIYRMNPRINELVQTSNNIAKVSVQDGNFSIGCLGRSSVDSEKMDLVNAIRAAFAGLKGTIELSGEYPGWEPKPDASIVTIMRNLYEELFKEKPLVDAVHAGLECGIIGTHYPDMEMISFGPNIYGAHSPDEKVQISSVQKFWKYLLEVLKRIPEAKS